MRLRLLLPLLLLLVIPMRGQVEHAPTPAQCHADADSWDVPPATPPYNNEEVLARYAMGIMRNPNISAKELDARKKELSQCLKTDNGILSARPHEFYEQAIHAYTIAELGRMADYLERHNLMTQFYDEDGQGKR